MACSCRVICKLVRHEASSHNPVLVSEEPTESFDALVPSAGQIAYTRIFPRRSAQSRASMRARCSLIQALGPVSVIRKSNITLERKRTMDFPSCAECLAQNLFLSSGLCGLSLDGVEEVARQRGCHGPRCHRLIFGSPG